MGDRFRSAVRKILDEKRKDRAEEELQEKASRRFSTESLGIENVTYLARHASAASMSSEGDLDGIGPESIVIDRAFNILQRLRGECEERNGMAWTKRDDIDMIIKGFSEAMQSEERLIHVSTPKSSRLIIHE